MTNEGATLTPAAQLCTELMRAESADEVRQALTAAGYWGDASAWRLFGDNDEAPPRAIPTHIPSEPLITPPAPEIEDLHALALEGNMRDIVQWAGRVTELDGRRYRQFANYVRRLAESYESQAILALAKQLLRAKTA